MQRILDLVSKFYKINDIEINRQKSVIIVINLKKVIATIVIQNEMILFLELGEVTRYLIIYILSKGINKLTIAKVEEEIAFITSKIIFKAITDK